MLGNQHVPFGKGPTEKGCLRNTRPSAYSTFVIGHKYLVQLCSLPLYFVRMKKVDSTIPETLLVVFL
jgi:hypothetical protein